MATKNCHKKGTFKTKNHGLTGGTIISGGTFFKKLFSVTGGTFILGGTFQKNIYEAYPVLLLEMVRLFRRT